jgi:hypothetical protein
MNDHVPDCDTNDKFISFSDWATKLDLLDLPPPHTLSRATLELPESRLGLICYVVLVYIVVCDVLFWGWAIPQCGNR